METSTIQYIVQRALTPDFAMDRGFVLAMVPLAIAALLFRRSGKRGPIWWAGVVLFVLFLPNAAYPLTDILHFVAKVRQRPYLPSWAISLIVMPQYFLYIGASFLAYAVSLRLCGQYLRRTGFAKLVVPVELLLHASTAVGVYLGRAIRMDSWDALTNPGQVVEASAGAFVVGTGLIVAVAYYAARYILDAIGNRRPADSSPEELLSLLHHAGFEVGRDLDGRPFVRRKGLNWPPTPARRDSLQV